MILFGSTLSVLDFLSSPKGLLLCKSDSRLPICTRPFLFLSKDLSRPRSVSGTLPFRVPYKHLNFSFSGTFVSWSLSYHPVLCSTWDVSK